MLVEYDCSPAQIVCVLRKKGAPICKQTIYKHIHVDGTGCLAMHAPHEMKYMRRMRMPIPTKATNIKNRTSIYDRPKG